MRFVVLTTRPPSFSNCSVFSLGATFNVTNKLNGNASPTTTYRPIITHDVITLDEVLDEMRSCFEDDGRKVAPKHMTDLDCHLALENIMVLPKQMKDTARKWCWYHSDQDISSFNAASIDRLEYRWLPEDSELCANGLVPQTTVHPILKRLLHVANSQNDPALGKTIDELANKFVYQVNQVNNLYSQLEAAIAKGSSETSKTWAAILDPIRDGQARTDSAAQSKKRRREE